MTLPSSLRHQIARETASLLLETDSILLSAKSPFTLTSGRKSPVYVDCRRLIGFPAVRTRLMEMAETILVDIASSFDVIAGGETAGIPYAAFLAERFSLPMAYIRKKPKGFGRNARIEGVLEKNHHVLLVEDLATDGGSKLSFVEAIREAGGQCEHCFVIFHYGIFPEKQKKLEESNVQLHALSEWRFVLEEATHQGMLDKDSLLTIQSFLDDPEGWKP